MSTRQQTKLTLPTVVNDSSQRRMYISCDDAARCWDRLTCAGVPSLPNRPKPGKTPNLCIEDGKASVKFHTPDFSNVGTRQSTTITVYRCDAPLLARLYESCSTFTLKFETWDCGKLVERITVFNVEIEQETVNQLKTLNDTGNLTTTVDFTITYDYHMTTWFSDQFVSIDDAFDDDPANATGGIIAAFVVESKCCKGGQIKKIVQADTANTGFEVVNIDTNGKRTVESYPNTGYPVSAEIEGDPGCVSNTCGNDCDGNRGITVYTKQGVFSTKADACSFDDIDTVSDVVDAADGFVLSGSSYISGGSSIHADDPTRPLSMLAASGDAVIAAGPADGTNAGAVISASCDCGVTWNRTTAQFVVNGTMAAAVDDRPVAVDVVNGTLFVLIERSAGVTYLIASEDCGETWELAGTFPYVGCNYQLINHLGESVVRIDERFWLNASGACNCGWGKTPFGTVDRCGHLAWSESGPVFCNVNALVKLTFPTVETDQITPTVNLTQGATSVPVWDFGDGSTATGASGAHTYATADEYTVCVTVDPREVISITALPTEFASQSCALGAFCPDLDNEDLLLDCNGEPVLCNGKPIAVISK